MMGDAHFRHHRYFDPSSYCDARQIHFQMGASYKKRKTDLPIDSIIGEPVKVSYAIPTCCEEFPKYI
jgi:hypothetical protein